MPSSKVTTQFLLGLVLATAAYLAKDTSWVPSQLAWAVPLLTQLIAAGGAYYKAENRPAPSTFTTGG